MFDATCGGRERCHVLVFRPHVPPLLAALPAGHGLAPETQAGLPKGPGGRPRSWPPPGAAAWHLPAVRRLAGGRGRRGEQLGQRDRVRHQQHGDQRGAPAVLRPDGEAQRGAKKAAGGSGAAGRPRAGRPGPALRRWRLLPAEQRGAPLRAARRETRGGDEEALRRRRAQDPGHGGRRAAHLRQELRPQAAQVLARHPAETVTAVWGGGGSALIFVHPRSSEASPLPPPFTFFLLRLNVYFNMTCL